MQGNTNIETTWNETSMWEKQQIEKAPTTIEQERNNTNTRWWSGSRRTTNQNQKKKNYLQETRTSMQASWCKTSQCKLNGKNNEEGEPIALRLFIFGMQTTVTKTNREPNPTATLHPSTIFFFGSALQFYNPKSKLLRTGPGLSPHGHHLMI